jgi:tetratricopeptide (TPR) repeat protein
MLPRRFSRSRAVRRAAGRVGLAGIPAKRGMFDVLRSIPTCTQRTGLRPGSLFVRAAVGAALLLAAGCGGMTSQGRNAEGVRLFQQARYHEALREFQEANYADPANPDTYYNLAATYHRLGAAESDSTYRDQAEQFYHMCLDRDDNHPDCYRGLAVLLAEQGRTTDATRLLEGWAARRPNSPDARTELARLATEFGDHVAAEEHLLAALNIDPYNDRANKALGKIREDSGNYAQALQNYQRSLQSNQFQPQVAARVSALRSSIGAGTTVDARGDATRLVDRAGEPRR